MVTNSLRESRRAVPNSGKPTTSPGLFSPRDGRLSFQAHHRFAAMTDRRCSFLCTSRKSVAGAGGSYLRVGSARVSIPGSRLPTFVSPLSPFVSPQAYLTPRSATTRRSQTASRCDRNSIGHGPSPSRAHLRERNTEIGSLQDSEHLY